MNSADGTTDGGSRRQVTPAELAALFVDAVSIPGEGEADAVRELSAALDLEAESVSGELLYLRAFAVDFAVLMGLGDSLAKDQILSCYYEHWTRIDEAEGDTLVAMEERLQAYAAAVGAGAHGQVGLSGEVGQAFAVRCVDAEGPPVTELMVLGGRLFAAVYDEMVGLLTEVDIVLEE